MTRQRNQTWQKTRRSTILHYWNNGYRSPAIIAGITKIPLRTVKYNIDKTKRQGSVEDRPRSSWLLKINSDDNKALGQWIRRNNERIG